MNGNLRPWARSAWAAIALMGCAGPTAPPPPPSPLSINGAPIAREVFVSALLADQGEAFAQRFAAEHLITTRAAEAGITVSDADLETRLTREIRKVVLQRFGGDEAKFEAQIKRYGLSMVGWRRNRARRLKIELLAEQLMRKDVPEAAVRAVFEQRYGQGGVRRDVHHLLISTRVEASGFYTRAMYAEAREGIETAGREAAAAHRRALLAGADFATLAKAHSDDFSAARGGDLGAEWGGRYGKAFDAAVAKLRVGDISPVVQSKRGFHVIQATGIRRGATYDGQIIKILAERTGAKDERPKAALLAEAKTRIEAIRARLEAGEDFATVARQVSDDQRSRARGGATGPFGPGHLGDRLDAALETLPLETISGPLETDDGYLLVRLSRRAFEPARDTLLVRHLLVGTTYEAVKARTLKDTLPAKAEAKAKALLARAASEDFEALAKAHSEDTLSKRRGGNLSPFVAGSLGPAVDAALAEMTVGSVRLVKSDRGYHLLKLDSMQRADFDAVRAELAAELAAKAPTPEEVEAWIKAQGEAAKVELTF